jgi:hypothetical protein
MSGKTPFFLSGGNARILVNNRTVAYATNVTYRISVRNAAPRVLGRAEVEAIQPLTYDVTGSLSIIKYGRGLQSYYGSQAPQGVDNKGNSMGSYGLSSIGGIVGGALGLPNSSGQFDGSPNEAFDPSRFFQSKMFNIEIRQTLPPSGNTGSSDNSVIGTLRDGTRQVLSSINDSLVRDQSSSGKNETPAVLLRDCRFEDLSFQLDKRGVATIQLTFRARYADGDDIIARKSGVGQELS